ncbi:membrane protein [Roseobacter cerasinus]|uniref:Probable membrane transporter protein n=1 Tax=Roseobacter cerasinus TaxID=2602289 RepID=A0A640VXF8_9RHOB|nr:sulfite exporter TauE/SafE family protein [Roseobacter cerasinus]GFE52352.1 membrane protein [Roseobacter cerasinus]
MLDLLATPGLVWVLAATFAAGLVYGFSGFGAALVYMPVATAFVAPPLAIGAFAVSALASLVTLVPRAWGQADRPNTLLMIGAAILCAPIGIWVLRTSDTDLIRWVLSGIISVTLILLIAGWRYHAAPSKRVRATIGAAAGVMMGSVGLNGPLVILFQLSGQDSIARSRANTLLFLTLTSLSLVPLMALQGLIGWEAVVLGLVMLVPYAMGTLLGRTLFDPDRERLYRHVAYAVVASAVLIGLPLWSH